MHHYSPLSCRRQRGYRLVAAGLIALLCSPAPGLLAQSVQVPQGGQVVHGRAAIDATSATRMVITQSSSRAVINWRDFSIGADGVVRIDQPDAASAILNRVVGDNPSLINGLLQSNGQVYLLNQRGIVVGPGGVIDTAAFLGSILHVSDGAFMGGGPLAFTGDSAASIVNLGVIRASTGDVVLLAPTIVNGGEIAAPRGTAALASGREVLLATGGDGSIIVKATIPAAEGVAVDNSGLIEGTEVSIAAAGSPYGLAVNNSGVIAATSMTSRGGRVRLDGGAGGVSNSGTVTARAGDRGGAVDVFGADITLADGSLIDVSGEAGGGVVRIGGGARGQDPSAPNAATVTVEAGASIRANATAAGDGGSVVIWSDQTTRYAGTIDARGGAAGGDGGQAEVSGGRLSYEGRVDLTAALGRTGTLLLDPADIDIDAPAAAAIAATLNTASVTQQATNSVTVSAAITNVTAANTLTLDAPTIAINAPIALPAATLQLLNSSGLGVSVLSALGASIDVKALTLAGNHPTTTLAGPVTTPLLTVDKAGATTGHITIDNAANAIGAVDFFGFDNSFTAGDIDIVSSTAMTVGGTLETGGTVAFRAGGHLTMTPGTAITTPSFVTLTAAGGTSAFINQAGPGLIGGTGRVVIYTGTDAGGYSDGGLGYAVHAGVNPGSDPVGAGNVIYVALASGLPPLVITADNKTAVYGSALPVFTASFTGGSAANLTAPVQFEVIGAHVNAGTYTIRPFGAASATHTLSFVNGTLTITPAPLVITASNATTTYGRPLPGFGATFSGLVNGDTSSVVSGLQFTTAATQASNVGTYAIVPSGASASNYAIAYVNGALTVNPAVLTVSVETLRRLYGGANPSTFTPIFSGFVNGDTAAAVSGLTFSTTAAVNSPVGQYDVMASGGSALNYTFDYVPGRLIIDPAPLVVMAVGVSYVYGRAVPNVFNNQFFGLVAGDTPGSLGLVSLADVTQGSPVGTYAIRLIGTASNYSITYIPDVVTITPAPLRVIANSFSRPYAAANPAFTAVIQGLYGSDTVSNLTFSTLATLFSNPGGYAIVPSVDPMSNYDIEYVNGVLTVGDITLVSTLDAPDDFDPTANNLGISLPDPTVRVFIQGTGLHALANNAPSVVNKALAELYALDPSMAASEKDLIDRYTYLMRNNMLGADKDVGKLMPLLVGQAKEILDRDPSTWSRDERNFIDYMTTVVMTQKQQAAEQAAQQLDQWKRDTREAAMQSGLTGLIYTQPVPPATFLEQAQAGVALDATNTAAYVGLLTAAGTLATAASAGATIAATGTTLAVVKVVAPFAVATIAKAVAGAGATSVTIKALATTASVTGAAAGAGAAALAASAAVIIAAIVAVAVTAARISDAGEYDQKMAEAQKDARRPVTAADLKAMLSSENGQKTVFSYLVAQAANNDAARRGGTN